MKIEQEDTTNIWIVWIVGFLLALLIYSLTGCVCESTKETIIKDTIIIQLTQPDTVIINTIDRQELIQIIDSIDEQQARITQGLLANLVARQMATEEALRDFAELADKKFSNLESKTCNIDSLFLMIQNVSGNYIIKGDELTPAARDSLLKILEPILNGTK